MSIQRQHSDVQRGVRDTGVRFEDGEYPQQGGSHEKGLRSEPQAETSDVAADMQPEDTQEEFSE